MSGQVHMPRHTQRTGRCEVQSAKRYTDQRRGITTLGERYGYVGRSPRLRPGGIRVHTGESSGITGRIDPRTVEGCTGLTKGQQALLTARDGPESIIDVRIESELRLQFDGEGRDIVVPIG